jgi:MFS family permease
MTGTSAARFTASLCVAEICTMLGYATFPTLLATLQSAWGMSNTEAGVVSGAYFGGYMLAVPLLTALTDRIEARRIYIFACALAAFGSFGFALAAQGFVSAALFQACVGAGLAGTYMPGLKILSDHVHGPRQSRYISFYTTCFSLGASGSFILPILVMPAWSWHGVFAISGAGPLIGAVIAWRMPAAARPPAEAARPARVPELSATLLDFRPVLKNRPAMGYVLGYSAHCWELLGSRSWLVAFIAFAAAGHGGSAVLAPALIAAFVNFLGMPSSIFGNELAMRYGRPRTILACMLLSGITSCVIGYTAAFSLPLTVACLCVYSALIMGDSSSLTAGTVAAALPDQRGITLALHSTLGFGAGLVSPALFGWVLDLAGGNGSVVAWGLAYASQGIFCLAAPLLLLLARGRRPAQSRR